MFQYVQLQQQILAKKIILSWISMHVLPWRSALITLKLVWNEFPAPNHWDFKKF